MRKLAAKLGLRCECGTWKESRTDASEDAARRARMDFLHSRTDLICFGHNRDDVAETILLRLGRGSGIDGLSGPRPVQRFRSRPQWLHLRPLLDISGSEIRRVLRESGIAWREDSTNATNAYARNRLRHQVLPLLDEALGRDWAAGAARSRALVEEADALVERASAKYYPINENDTLSRTRLAALPTAMARRTLDVWLSTLGLREKAGAAGIDRILEGLKPSDTPPELSSIGLQMTDTELRPLPEFRPPPRWRSCSVSTKGCKVFFPDGSTLSIEPLSLDKEEAEKLISQMKREKDNYRAIIRAPEASSIELRLRKDGDRYRPLGGAGETKLSDAFVNRKIPLAERGRIPLVLIEDRLAWAPGLPPAEDFRLSTDTSEALRLIYSRVSNKATSNL